MAFLKSSWFKISLIPKEQERGLGRMRGRNMKVGDRKRKDQEGLSPDGWIGIRKLRKKGPTAENGACNGREARKDIVWELQMGSSLLEHKI